MQEKSQRELQKTAGLNWNDIFDEKLAFKIALWPEFQNYIQKL